MKAKNESPSPENNAQNPPTPVPTTPPVSVPIPGPTMEERLSGPPSKAGDRISSDDLVLEHRIRWRCQTDSDKEAAAAVDESKKTISRAIEEYDDPLLIHRRPSKRKKRQPLPSRPDNAETSTDD